MTELCFLLDLFLEEKLPKSAKAKVVARLKALEGAPRQAVASNHQQAASTLAAMARQAEEPQPVEVIAQTVATAQALNRRQESIAIATSGIPEKGRTSPRKF